jgi:hypothetical protein
VHLVSASASVPRWRVGLVWVSAARGPVSMPQSRPRWQKFGSVSSTVGILMTGFRAYAEVVCDLQRRNMRPWAVRTVNHTGEPAMTMNGSPLKELRLLFTSAENGSFTVCLEDSPGHTVGVPATLTPFLTDADFENLRWYLEDYMDLPAEPACPDPPLSRRSSRRRAPSPRIPRNQRIPRPQGSLERLQHPLRNRRRQRRHHHRRRVGPQTRRPPRRAGPPSQRRRGRFAVKNESAHPTAIAAPIPRRHPFPENCPLHIHYKKRT